MPQPPSGFAPWAAHLAVDCDDACSFDLQFRALLLDAFNDDLGLVSNISSSVCDWTPGVLDEEIKLGRSFSN
jgi:hypothetical protein